MHISKTLIVIGLCILFSSCGSDTDKIQQDLSIHTNADKNVIQNDETLTLSIANPEKHKIESVTYTLNGESINENTDLSRHKVGANKIEAKILIDGLPYIIVKEITILSSVTPNVYGFNIINEYPHDIEAYTQGLEFHNGILYESIGQYGKSELRQLNFKTGDVEKNVVLDNNYFAEGLTILNNNIYQLTWRENIGFIYDIETFERKNTFNYNNSKEGWGLCNDGMNIYKSDGTEKIWRLDPETLEEKSYIQAYHTKGKTTELNELEWIEGKIFANRYQLNGVAIINPENGVIEGVVDFSPLVKKVTQHSKLDVLNGIAYNPETKTIFVTGKYWDKLFEVELVEK